MDAKKIVDALEGAGLSYNESFERMLDYAMFEIAYPLYEGFAEASLVASWKMEHRMSLREERAYELALALVAQSVADGCIDVLRIVKDRSELASCRERERLHGASLYLEKSAKADPRGWLNVSAGCDEVLAIANQLKSRGFSPEESMVAYVRSCELTRFKMDYVQLAFANVPALVAVYCCGKKIQLYTPEFILSGWIERIAGDEPAEDDTERQRLLRQLSLFEL